MTASKTLTSESKFPSPTKLKLNDDVLDKNDSFPLISTADIL